MKLSPKAIRFIVEALDSFVCAHDRQTQSVGVSEDEIADWENDRRFIEAIKSDCLDELAHQVEQAQVAV